MTSKLLLKSIHIVTRSLREPVARSKEARGCLLRPSKGAQEASRGHSFSKCGSAEGRSRKLEGSRGPRTLETPTDFGRPWDPPPMGNRGSWFDVRGSRLKVQGSKVEDKGSRFEDRIFSQVLRSFGVSSGVLVAIWQGPLRDSGKKQTKKFRVPLFENETK